MNKEINLQRFISQLEEYEIASVTWTIFYDSDETHFEDDPVVLDIHGNQIQVSKLTEKPGGGWICVEHPAFVFSNTTINYQGNNVEDWKSLLWLLADKFSNTGVFKLDVREKTLTRMQDAYMTEPELELFDVDPIQYSFDVTQPDGIWEGPLYPEWSKKDKSSPYRVQIWVDDDFTPSAYFVAGSLGTYEDAKKRGWFNWKDFKTSQEAIKYAYTWHKTGTPSDTFKVRDPSEKPEKGFTATRVIDAWNEEVYIVSKKGVIHDKRGPYKIQCKGGYFYNITGSNHWVDMFEIPLWKKPDGMTGFTYSTVNDAEFYITKYIEINNTKINFSIRIVDKENHLIKSIHTYVAPGTELSRTEKTIQYLKGSPIKSNQTIIEIAPYDFYAMVADLKRSEQQKWLEAYALRYYGDNSYRISVETTSEYDDQSSYFDRIDSITVYDEDDNILSLDPHCIQSFLEEDPDRYLNAIMYYTEYNSDDPIRFLSNYTGSRVNYTIDSISLKDLDLNHYKTFDNVSFFDYVKDNFIDEFMDEEESMADASNIAGDYIFGEPVTFDPRWKNMRIFSLMDNEDNEND